MNTALKMLKRIASLVTCCTFVWTASIGLFLLFCRFLGVSFFPDIDARNADQSIFVFLFSIGSALRDLLHNTWLFLAAFAALGVAGVFWVSAEKWQKNSKWSRREASWMAWFGVSLSSAAFLYGLGTNGVLAKRFARSATITDWIGLGLAVAVPIVLWSRWRRSGKTKASESLESESRHFSFDTSRTVLGLNSGYTPARLIEHATEAAPMEPISSHPLPVAVTQPTEWLDRTFHERMEPAVAITTSTPKEIEIMQIVESGTEVMLSETSEQEQTAVALTNFREQLAELNASWKRIEDTGEEVEEWFRWQKERVIAHLERHPGMRRQNAPLDFSRDFLEQRLQRVDAAWSAIHASVREMNRWLENNDPRRELADVTKAR